MSQFYVIFAAGESIQLKPGFHAKENFNAYIAECNVDVVALKRGVAQKNKVEEKEVYHSEMINIFPNPAYNTVTISSNQAIKDGTVYLINTLGQVIFQETITGYSLELSIQDLPTGMYYISIENNEFQTIKKLIIKH